MMQLSEAAALPLVTLCTCASQSQVQCSTSQAVARLAQRSEHARRGLLDAGILPPLTHLLASGEASVQLAAAVAIRHLSYSSTRRSLLAQPAPMLALMQCASGVGQHSMAGSAALWALSNACAVASSTDVFLQHVQAAKGLLEALRLHLPPLVAAHMPAAMLLQHLASIVSHGYVTHEELRASIEATMSEKQEL